VRKSLALAMLLFLVACAAGPAARSEAPGLRAASLAKSLIGTPYRYGGADPAGFDCSGLVHYVYGSLGVSLPRTAAEQHGAVRPVPRGKLRPGDLVFFELPKEHVGIYVGDGLFVHAPGSHRRVEAAHLDGPVFSDDYAGGGRVFR
jgi:murein DD-endopeptidase